MDLLYDCLIRNARILDGSGAPAFSGDVALSGGSIAAVGELYQAAASHIIDAAGRYVPPGLCDIARPGPTPPWRTTAPRRPRCPSG